MATAVIAVAFSIWAHAAQKKSELNSLLEVDSETIYGVTWAPGVPIWARDLIRAFHAFDVPVQVECRGKGVKRISLSLIHI